MTDHAPHIDPEPPTLSLWWHFMSLFVCYLLGVIFVAFAASFYRRSIAFTLLIAPVCGLPFLVLAFAGVLFFKTAIEQNPVPFLISVPFAAALCWCFIDVTFLGGHFDEDIRFGAFGFLRYSLSRRLGFAFFVSGFSSFLYYRHLKDAMERARNKREALKKMEGL